MLSFMMLYVRIQSLTFTFDKLCKAIYNNRYTI